MAHILIIERPEIADILSFVLNEEGHITSVVDGINGVDEIEKINPKVVFVHERNQGKLSGHILIRMIKTNPATQHIKAILTSTRNDIKILAQRACADGYLPKPFDLDEIPALVKNVMG